MLWKRNWMDPDVHTMLLDMKLLKATLWNMYNPILMETILKALREQSEEDDQMKPVGDRKVQYHKLCSNGNQPWTSEENSGNDNPENIHWWSGVDREPGLVQGLVAEKVHHAEEITEEIDEAGISAITFDCGTGRKWWSTCRRCLWDCSNARHRRLAQTSFVDESVDSTSKVLVSTMMSASLSFDMKDYDISRAYFQGTMEKLIYI